MSAGRVCRRMREVELGLVLKAGSAGERSSKACQAAMTPVPRLLLEEGRGQGDS